MAKNNSTETGKEKPGKMEVFYNNAEWFIVAICVTLVFIVFQMQAYTIPTGSMADTLKGAHFRLRCSQCAYQFDYNFSAGNYRDKGIPENKTPGYNVGIRPLPPRCPSCGFYQDLAKGGYFLETGQTGDMPVMKGDRIFVLKCIYQFQEPKRWDVIVFKNPTQPEINYIKRLVGLPGETVEIIDGNIFIDGKIVRKNDKVQEELWMPVYDNDYQPARPEEERFNRHSWKQPFVNEDDSKWELESDSVGVFNLSSNADDINYIVYDTSLGNDFRATYAYDDALWYSRMPVCSDIMVRYYVSRSSDGISGVGLSKYGRRYRAWVEPSGNMVIGEINDRGETVDLIRTKIEMPAFGDSVLLRFANVDHQLVFEFAGEKLVYDLGVLPDSAGQWPSEEMPRAAIFGSGDIELSHVGVLRDIHYLSREYRNGGVLLRGGEGNPITLGEDEFFVLGDNSPMSADSRYWQINGNGNGDTEYRMGIVPRDYLVGKAFFVYWPGPYKPSDKFIRIVPNIDGMKVIYGGGEDKSKISKYEIKF